MSPYGETKLVGEWLVTRRRQGARHAPPPRLRYFNVAGAATPELADTGVFNLVPMVFERLDAGEPPRIFGDDYPTPGRHLHPRLHPRRRPRGGPCRGGPRARRRTPRPR